MERYTPEFKVRVVLEALRSRQTNSAVAEANGVHPVTLSRWKTQLIQDAQSAFRGDTERELERQRCTEATERLGQLESEFEMLREMLESEVSIEAKIRFVDQYRDQIGLNRACELFKLPKSTYYYRTERRNAG